MYLEGVEGRLKERLGRRGGLRESTSEGKFKGCELGNHRPEWEGESKRLRREHNIWDGIGDFEDGGAGMEGGI